MSGFVSCGGLLNGGICSKVVISTSFCGTSVVQSARVAQGYSKASRLYMQQDSDMVAQSDSVDEEAMAAAAKALEGSTISGIFEGSPAALLPINMQVREEKIAQAVSENRLHENDSGSPEAQIAKLSVKITMLTEHAKANPKDHSSTRGLLQMVATRKRLLNYLRREDPDRFQKLVGNLNIRLSKDMAFAAKTVVLEE
mmetsp:Transcript_7804/g.14176  ORF Transcript_7804/g.14176 Transcript_7804/m.14176 type:complete len:198 (-) Transcript_7804:230-823(-)|eukprot:CAMPEP_0182445248 /NCGR_PEP_ID=MMETSP1172-20130603/3438_1 /TAXON_ID=708627 /ORGANISM="Timspurckia oligopyrenoides, Strain CCMP3278" /LENGTH=197 /DNA_ID=CAMNT_0024640981 /DNA_START=60 /DNA_END=653 /DNA_ORIENTATION=+